MKRLFIAVDISEQARNLAAKYIAELRAAFPEVRVGWERPEKLHLTLKFLGRTSEEQLDAIAQRLKSVADTRRRFRLVLTGRGLFPSARNPRVLWLGIRDVEKKLADLANAVIDEMADLGFEPEKRGFKAHLTIARIKDPPTGGPLAEKHLQMEYEPVEFSVDEIVLYESHLRPKGSIYTKLAIFPILIDQPLLR
jgi:2'-5' RNA ligase